MMIITTSKSFTKEEINKLQEEFDTYIKTVIDVHRKICSAGANRHFESEQLLLKDGSEQKYIWGGGIDLETKVVDFNSFINIRPQDQNASNEIQNLSLRKTYEELMKYFFHVVYEQ